MVKPKILFLESKDPLDKTNWSGTLYYMHNALNKHFEVINSGPVLKRFYNLLWKINKKTYSLLKKKYNLGHSKVIGGLHLLAMKHQLRKDYDVIFAATSREISQLKTDKPIILCTDATFDLLNNYYSEFSDLFPFSIKESHEVEQQAINKASILIYSSQWAADSAIRRYNADKSKVFVIPYGANIDLLPEYDIERKTIRDKINILFLATNWERKGGDTVYKTFNLLRQKHLNIQLTICGCTPPFKINDENVQIIPYLNKNKKEDLEKFHRLLQDTHLLFVPSRADCTPIVFCEAAAYGIPIISNKTGGIPSLIEDGINGFCLDVNATEAEYAEKINEIVSDVNYYRKFSLSSREKFITTLNWNNWGQQIFKITQDLYKANRHTMS